MVMTIEQVCDRLGCKRSQVFKLLREGVIERAPRFGKQIRIYTDSVDRAQARPEKQARKLRAVAAPGPVSRSEIKW